MKYMERLVRRAPVVLLIAIASVSGAVVAHVDKSLTGVKGSEACANLHMKMSADCRSPALASLTDIASRGLP